MRRGLTALGFAAAAASLLGVAGAVAVPVAGSVAAAASGETASQMASRATSTSKEAGSVKVSGTILESSGDVRVDLTAGHGSGQGTLAVNGVTVSLIYAGSAVYINAPRAFWNQNGGSTEANRYAGKWAKTTASSGGGQDFAESLEAKTLVSQILGVTNRSQFADAGTSVVDGKTVKVLRVTPRHGRGSRGSLDIASTGPPYVLRVALRTSGSGSRTYSLSLSDYGQPVNVAAPPNAVTIRS